MTVDLVFTLKEMLEECRTGPDQECVAVGCGGCYDEHFREYPCNCSFCQGLPDGDEETECTGASDFNRETE